MPLPPEQRLSFFVYAIESPSATDLYHGRSEGECLGKLLRLNEIGCIAKTIVSRETFVEALYAGLSEAMYAEPDKRPIVHISAHGSMDGIQLTDEKIISWDELRELLKPINLALNNGLIVCMSSCHGYAGTRMAMQGHEHAYPFFALIGTGAAPSWPETAIGYSTFYHQLARGEHITDAVEAMRVASGHVAFYVQWATFARRGYLEFLQTTNVSGLEMARETLRNTGTVKSGKSFLPSEANLVAIT